MVNWRLAALDLRHCWQICVADCTLTCQTNGLHPKSRPSCGFRAIDRDRHCHNSLSVLCSHCVFRFLCEMTGCCKGSCLDPLSLFLFMDLHCHQSFVDAMPSLPSLDPMVTALTALELSLSPSPSASLSPSLSIDTVAINFPHLAHQTSTARARLQLSSGSCQI